MVSVSIFQGFEGTANDNWSYTNNPATYNTSGDVWALVPSFGSIPAPSEGSNFWGMQDLNNPNGGGAFDHIITLDTIDTSTYNDVLLAFDYNAVGYDAGDTLSYEVVYDSVSQNIIPLVEGVNNGGFSTSDWETETINVPDSVNSVSLNLIADQNGGSDFAGWDNIVLTGETASASVPFEFSPSLGIVLIAAVIGLRYLKNRLAL